MHSHTHIRTNTGTNAQKHTLALSSQGGRAEPCQSHSTCARKEIEKTEKTKNENGEKLQGKKEKREGMMGKTRKEGQKKRQDGRKKETRTSREKGLGFGGGGFVRVPSIGP